MISGRQTLASLDEALAEERGKLDAVEQRIQSLSESVVAGQKVDAGDYRDLARLRIDLLEGGDLVAHIDQAERQVLALLEKREAAAGALDERLQAAEVERRTLEVERAAQASQVDRAAEGVDEAEALTQARLDADPAYQAQRQRAHEAERTAMHAEEKAASSEQEKDQKGESYRSDPLFIYLWERNYGLPTYEASSLFRWLDGKVARLIGFADARANYSRLNEIPRRLREHAERRRAAADAEFQVLRELDRKAREADGISALERRVEARQGELDAIDRRIEAAETEHQTLLAQKAAFASGEDEQMRKAVEYLAAEFRRDDLMELRREALATPFPDDDLVVSRILDREHERQRAGGALEGLKETLLQHSKRLSELEAVRTEFRRHRYDRAGSSFSDGGLIAMMLSNFLNGMLDRRTLWKVLQEQQRYRPRQSDPGFGSGGFGRGTVWGGGVGDLPDFGDVFGQRSRGASRGGRGGGLGSGGGGGFRTGGGF